ncbi:hypothetical protein F4802DRAFT_275051 [Xylaria palmicola]|nr:hypothetical protein F4802DRAFT_275051 [Xylaria palmicola]
MNQIRAIQALNKREIENGVSPNASWHTDYRDTAFVNFGGLPYELTEGDIITIFSQYGEPVFLKLARDKETGRSKGFGWLKYEDQRSCDLAVDNLGGAEIAGRLLRVDHARYKARDDEDPAEFAVAWADMTGKEKAARGGAAETEDEDEEGEEAPERPMIKEEVELRRLIEEHDDDDPMKGFLIEEKKREVAEALDGEKSRKERKERKHHRHHHRSHHRSRRDKNGDRRDGRPTRDATPVMDVEKGRDRDETPPRMRDSSRDRDRERRRRGDDYEKDRDGDRRRDREGGGREYRKHDRQTDRRVKYREGEDRDTDKDGHRKRRRRSRTSSPHS